MWFNEFSLNKHRTLDTLETFTLPRKNWQMDYNIKVLIDVAWLHFMDETNILFCFMSSCVPSWTETAVESDVCWSSESSGSGNLWQTQDQSPLLPSKAPSLELKLTQLRNIIAFKAHLNLFITIIHSLELLKSSHQSRYSGKKKLNGQYS